MLKGIGRSRVEKSKLGETEVRLSTESIATEKAGHEPQPDLLSLIQRTAAHDEASLARLYDLVSPIVFGLSLRILGNTTAAEETVVEVFSAIWDRACRFEAAGGTPLVWITSITRTRSIARLRSAVNVVPIAVAPDSPGGAADERPKVEGWFSRDSDGARRALEGLPADLRRTLEMGYFEGLTAEEIGARLLVAPETVRARIRSGMIQLRQALGPVIR